MKWVVRILQALLIVAFVMAGIMKLTGNVDQVELFTETFDYSKSFMYFVGVCEILGALGLLIGFWKSKIALLASGGLVLLMGGAAYSHFNAGQGFEEAMRSLVLFVLGIVVFIGKIK
ncbi:DoxX family protein [Jeotgalibacillus marinus]|uniref:DoxX family protein n=1 Tax=Jeotgalibacillus marinus TaxID=86667 RepID=A0ABV3Q1P9_9BACL